MKVPNIDSASDVYLRVADSLGSGRTTAPWQHVITPEELEIYREAGFGRPFEGEIRPALLVIDVQYRSVGHARLPILESIKREYPTSCGEYGWRAVPHISRLIHAFRARGFPVVFPHVAYKESHDGQRFAEKAPAIMSIPRKGYEMVEECAPCAGDILLPKHHASAFFGTPLVSYLTTFDVNCVVVTGTTTSGCVRASTVDASSYGYHVIVPHDAVFDRSQTSHAVNLFDMHSKYADVMSTEEVINLMPLASAPMVPCPAE
ncbi:MAG TPA: isochorismatase family protein [Advenella sp.]|nr:isochorismatase family protein [Advenella sp.]